MCISFTIYKECSYVTPAAGALGAVAVLFSLPEGWLTLGPCTCLNLTAAGRTDTCFALLGRDLGMRPPLFTPQTEAWWSPVSVVIFVNHHLLPLLPKKGVLWVIQRPGKKPWLLGWFLAIKGQTGGVVEVSLTFEGKTPLIHRLPESQPLGYVPIIYVPLEYFYLYSLTESTNMLTICYKAGWGYSLDKTTKRPFCGVCVCEIHPWNAHWKPTMW